MGPKICHAKTIQKFPTIFVSEIKICCLSHLQAAQLVCGQGQFENNKFYIKVPTGHNSLEVHEACRFHNFAQTEGGSFAFYIVN
jgi:hypothetical protein